MQKIVTYSTLPHQGKIMAELYHHPEIQLVPLNLPHSTVVHHYLLFHNKIPINFSFFILNSYWAILTELLKIKY